MERDGDKTMSSHTKESHTCRATLSNCYNCGRTVYGVSDANAGGHVFCSRKCRAEWEHCQARRRAAEAAAKHRAEEARRIREKNVRINVENARIDAENARRRQIQAGLNQEAAARDKRNRYWAWAVGILLILWAIASWF